MLFTELLQVSLGTREALSRAPNDAEWQAIFEEAQRQAIVGVVVDGMERLAKAQLPSQEPLLQWIGTVQMMESSYATYVQRARELSALFRSKRYGSCLLKGISVAQYYPHPARRQEGDIDLWVDGDRMEIMAWLRSEYAIDHSVWHNVGVGIFQDVPVEVHFHPGWLCNPMHNRRLQRWFETEKKNIISGSASQDVIMPPVEFNAVYSLVHSQRHLIAEGLGLRHVVDYFYILKSLPAVQKPEVLVLLKRFGMLNFASGMMWVLQHVCGMPSEYLLCEANEREGRFILNEVLRGGNFGHHRSDSYTRNSFARMWAMLSHYTSEVLWSLPWKVWHRCWRLIHKGKLA